MWNRVAVAGLCLVLAGAPLAQAQRVEWDEPATLRVTGAGKLKLDGARLLEWSRGGKEAAIPFDVAREGEVWLVKPRRPLDLKAQHALALRKGPRLPVHPDGVLDSFICREPLGEEGVDGARVFRLFAPRARGATLRLYAQPGDAAPLLAREAIPADDGSWSVSVPEAQMGMAWTWSVDSPTGLAGWTDPLQEFADPWAGAVATRNDVTHAGRALLLDETYTWKAADWTPPPADSLIILESHLRDATAGPGAGAGSLTGSYPGYWQAATGGLAHARSLGVTAVQFLPLQEFGNIELDYKSKATPVFNDWNPWSRNHWGYMTSAFLAPEAYYASGQNLEPGGWCGLDGRQVREFRELVDQCHAAGLAVILDVVYNHVSQYDHNPLKLLDTAYWFRLADDGSMTSASGCGNDLRTERPLARRLILDSVRRFAEDFRVDGFRFDLGAMLDDATLTAVRDYTREKGLFLTAEPWGGGAYEPERFARLGWSWWNDRYRVDLRGRRPEEGSGFLFGGLHAESSLERLAAGVQGYREGVPAGFNTSPLQAVNYVAAHDDHDLGDWIKLGLGLSRPDTVVVDRLAYQRLTEEETRVHGLAALHLLSSAGVPMLHLGQELGRCKIIAKGGAEPGLAGRIDHNSYEKDNATNWIDWRLQALNRPLGDLVRKAVAFRRSHPALATAERKVLTNQQTQARLAWTSAEAGVAAVFNSHPEQAWDLQLPGTARLGVASGKVLLDAESGLLRLGPRSAVLLEWQP